MELFRGIPAGHENKAVAPVRSWAKAGPGRQGHLPACGVAIRTVWIQVAMGLLAAAAAGAFLFLFWRRQGLPDSVPANFWSGGVTPEGLALFAALALPAAAWMPTLILAILLHLWLPSDNQKRPDLTRGLLAQDAATYLFLPAIIMVPYLWQELSNGFLALALCFMGLLTIKTVILLRAFWLGFGEPAGRLQEKAGKKTWVALFLLALTVFGLSGAWTQQASPPLNQEMSYLLAARALSTGEKAPLLTGKDASQASWGQWKGSPSPDYQPYLKEPFTFLLSPVLALGGRPAAHGLAVLLAALLAVLLVVWLQETRVATGAAAAAVWVVLFSAPFIMLCRQVGPDLLAAVLLLGGLCLLPTLPAHPWPAGLGLAGIALGLVFLQTGYWPLAAGLLLVGLGASLRSPKAEEPKGRRGWLSLGLAAALALILSLAAWNIFGGASSEIFGLGASQANSPSAVSAPVQGSSPGAFYLNMLLMAPAYLLALAGMPAAWRLYSRNFSMALLPLILMAGWFWLSRAFPPTVWPNGLTVALTPFLTLCLAPCLLALNRSRLRVLWAVPVALSLGWVWLITLFPILGRDPAEAIDLAAAVLGQNLRINMSHILPLGPGLDLTFFAWLAGFAFITAVLAVYCWRAAGQGEKTMARPWSPAEFMGLALAMGILLGGLLAAGALLGA